MKLKGNEIDNTNNILGGNMKNVTTEKDVYTLVDKADILINESLLKINNELINLYWSIGKLVNDYRRENNSSYGDNVYVKFADKLSLKYGKGFSRRNINNMCLFHEIFSKLNPGSKINENWHPGANFKNICWTHIRELLKFKDIKVIEFYLNEVEKKQLSKRELIEFIKSKSFERTIANQKQGTSKNKIEKTLRDPIILNIHNKKRSEKELEKEILNNISSFKREIGSHVMFFESQYKLNINGLIHKVDLVFFDNDINSYILVDLKIKKVTNKDIYQMQMYVNHFNVYLKKDKISNTIGIILCETKDLRVLNNEDIYQIKYLSEIPKDKELLKIINDNKIILLKTEHLKM